MIKYVKFKRSKLELERNLEQLRALENNMLIHVGYTKSPPLSVDTEKDLIEIKKLMEKNEKNKIAIQGELGAYSHIAANDLFKDAEIKTCATFEETFKMAFEDETYKIIIPIENSLAGRVADIHYLLPKYKFKFMENIF